MELKTGCICEVTLDRAFLVSSNGDLHELKKGDQLVYVGNYGFPVFSKKVHGIASPTIMGQFVPNDSGVVSSNSINIINYEA